MGFDVWMQILRVTVLSILLTEPAFSADIKIHEWKFDSDPPGSVPGDFMPGKINSEAGRWRVVEDPKAPTPPNVLAREATDPAANGQIIFIDGLEVGSLDLTVRVKTSLGGEKQGAGVVFRAIDERNYYLIWISPAKSVCGWIG